MTPSRPALRLVFSIGACAAVALAASMPAAAQEAAPLAPLPPATTPPVPGMEPVPVLGAPIAPVAAPPQQAPRMVSIHVNADRAVVLQVLTPYETRWRDVCVSPCDTDAPLDGVYRVAAPGIMGSREVELEAAPGQHVVLDANIRTVAQHRTAERLTIAGYIVGAIGLGLEVGALAVDSSSTSENVLLWSGAGAAVAAVTLAITAYVRGQPSGLSQASEGESWAPAASSPPRAALLLGPEPLWKERALVFVPSAVSAPVVTLKF